MTTGDKPQGSHFSLRSALPNLITLFAICVGLSGVRLAFTERTELAVVALVVAMVMDGIDGRVARALNSQSAMGKELDSLADFFNFGIAPGLILFMTIFSGTAYANFGWVAVMFLAVSCAFRLARFNSSEGDEVSLYFEGVPAPILALLSLIPVYLHLLGVTFVTDHPVLVTFYLFFCGFLAASRIPTVSLKALKLPTSSHSLVIVFVTVVFASGLVFPWETLSLFGLLYLISLPIFAKRLRSKFSGSDAASED